MRQYGLELKNFFRKGDVILLVLCLFASAFGCLVIASATNYTGTLRQVYVQGASICIGVLVYILVSSFDIGFLCEHRRWLVALSIAAILMLLTPFGTDNGTGNRSWLRFPFFPVDIQPAEFVKIFFVLILASVMASHQDRVSHVVSVVHMLIHFGLIFVLNWQISGDLGVSLIFLAIFGGMAFAGGVRLYWFGIAIAGVVAAAPIIWQFLAPYQQNRIMVVFDPTIDPQGLQERYHMLQSQKSLNAGGLTGQGLFHGNRTQAGALYAQHTDFIFSSIGEEMGYLGCLLVMVMLAAIIIRCIYVGTKSPDYLRKLICFGVAAALIFQMVLNIGMCMGLLPIVGLTLPFISYGGSSTVSLFAMVGLVSGIHARPQRPVHERYVYAPIGMEIKERRKRKESF